MDLGQRSRHAGRDARCWEICAPPRSPADRWPRGPRSLVRPPDDPGSDPPSAKMESGEREKRAGAASHRDAVSIVTRTKADCNDARRLQPSSPGRRHGWVVLDVMALQTSGASGTHLPHAYAPELARIERDKRIAKPAVHAAYVRATGSACRPLPGCSSLDGQLRHGGDLPDPRR
jgi:hypothetical protein